MICYLVRHGKDDETIRGGWSDGSLSNEGIAQVEQVTMQLFLDSNIKIGRIFTSDLMRAKQTATIINRAFHVPQESCPQFREVNNGLLAGIKNDVAALEYPGLYWDSLDWEEAYPFGESPKQFYERISRAWEEFKASVCDLPYDVMLVTHGGVINVISCLESGVAYSNKSNPFPVKYAEVITMKI